MAGIEVRIWWGGLGFEASSLLLNRIGRGERGALLLFFF